MKTHNERVISEEHWNDEGLSEPSCCLECSAPDLNLNNHVSCFLKDSQTGEMVLVEVICIRCWEYMGKGDQQDWIDYFDEVIEP